NNRTRTLGMRIRKKGMGKADRGFLVYAGQPQACRKCGSTGHNADSCEQMRCRSCGKIGHITKDCKEPRKCHLCDSETHMARDCTRPRSYSEAAKSGTKDGYHRKTDTETDTERRAQEAPTAAEDQTNEERDGSKEGGAEQRKEEGGNPRELDAEREKQGEDGQVWEV
uniref:CCHC-type domain-containing protein n=1 Tax=Maylandia zebra TaxID=106582 RepID=A0A3P9DF01_9CICH